MDAIVFKLIIFVYSCSRFYIKWEISVAKFGIDLTHFVAQADHFLLIFINCFLEMFYDGTLLLDDGNLKLDCTNWLFQCLNCHFFLYFFFCQQRFNHVKVAVNGFLKIFLDPFDWKTILSWCWFDQVFEFILLFNRQSPINDIVEFS